VICITFQMIGFRVNALAKVSAELTRRIARMIGEARTAPPHPRSNAFGQSSRLVRRPRNLRLLSELPADLPTKLFVNANRLRLAAGKILFRAGAIGDGCYRVEDGLLKVTMVSSSGAERILEFFGPGAIVGELSTIDGLPRSATVVAVRDATLSWLSRAEFEVFAEEHPEVYKSLVKLLAHRLRDTDTVVAASSFLSLKGRVARTMLELADHFGQQVAPGRIVIRQKIGQNDLAAMAGIARESLTRVLNDWERHKVLSRLSGYYCLENKRQLEHQAKL
jgi:CRP/FNR family transcriptional regulator, cyclic AMP receptor protein